VSGYAASLVPPAVDLSVLGTVAIRELAVPGAPAGEIRAARRLLPFASLVTWAPHATTRSECSLSGGAQRREHQSDVLAHVVLVQRRVPDHHPEVERCLHQVEHDVGIGRPNLPGRHGGPHDPASRRRALM